MSIGPDNPEFERAEILIDHLIQVDGSSGNESGLDLKLDVLERMIELLRIRNRRLKNELPVEEFLQGDVCYGGDHLRFTLPHEMKDLGSGTEPIRLQPKLLLFLLIYHRRAYRVLDIIEGFVDKVWDHLDVLDFKRTETGVFRCYTNTRFAANMLRDYGLLKFTQREAYKTWVLSLPGFLVASLVLERYKDDWKVPRLRRIHNFDLHDDIRNAWVDLQTYDEYVRRLAFICEPHTDIFRTFDDVLRKAHGLLGKYWAVLQDHTMTQVERHEASIELLKRIEELPTIEQFYYELSKCIDLQRVLGDIQ